jgi:hypothetical protein
MSSPIDPTAAAIDAMVQQQTPTGPANNSTPDMRLNNDGTVEVLRASPAGGPVVVPEAGFSMAGQVEALNNEITRIEAELAEGVFGNKGNRTGDRFTDRDRDVRNAQLASLRSSREFQMLRGLQVADQRAADAAARERADAEAAAAGAFHQGSPEKAALLQKEIDAAEARRIAEAIVKGRNRG